MSTAPVRFETLIEFHHDEIYRYLWRLLANCGGMDRKQAAEDLAQEVFLRGYRAFPRLRPDSNHRAWLYKIATNCAYTLLKQRSPETQDLLVSFEEELISHADGSRSPYEQAAMNETWDDVARAVVRLPLKQRTALVLRYVQGLDYAEIAQALACSEESARANVYQALRRLRREMANVLAQTQTEIG